LVEIFYDMNYIYSKMIQVIYEALKLI